MTAAAVTRQLGKVQGTLIGMQGALLPPQPRVAEFRNA